MAAAKKCDRCKRYYDCNKVKAVDNRGYFLAGVITVYNHPNGGYFRDKIFELCDDCLQKLYGFLHPPMEEADI